MLQKIQPVFDSNLITSHFIIIWSPKMLVIRMLETYLYGQARNAQTICKKIATFVQRQ